jgi:hypothetical protein
MCQRSYYNNKINDEQNIKTKYIMKLTSDIKKSNAANVTIVIFI